MSHPPQDPLEGHAAAAEDAGRQEQGSGISRNRLTITHNGRQVEVVVKAELLESRQTVAEEINKTRLKLGELRADKGPCQSCVKNGIAINEAKLRIFEEALRSVH